MITTKPHKTLTQMDSKKGRDGKLVQLSTLDTNRRRWVVGQYPDSGVDVPIGTEYYTTVSDAMIAFAKA